MERLQKSILARTLATTSDHPPVSDRRPSRPLSEKSLRLLIPLRDVEARFGGWNQFFALLADFVQLKNDEFIRRFEQKSEAAEAANRIVDLKPNMFGIGVNLNEVIDRWRKRHAKHQPGTTG